MAEVGESKTEIRETKQGLELEREVGMGNHKRTKKKLKEQSVEKAELVDGSFQELGVSKWRTWWSRWSALGVLKG